MTQKITVNRMVTEGDGIGDLLAVYSESKDPVEFENWKKNFHMDEHDQWANGYVVARLVTE